ncbi:hypothetical protein [Thermococcus gorgonarius]|uniref:Uncharacterized protein n=1 Tax=Thermococcus gorgonarius TaxID=71997 RepID=A0A2Z2M4W3_THEGO|nr:hypothetical protein [Thermococcus gorgonarius]ASJ01100.1 hypothetical protein A3K92_06200 [Thermococcus gorgonarius]
MLDKRYLTLVVVTAILASLILLQGEKPSGESFIGVCVKSYDSFSVLFDGNRTVLIDRNLDEGKLYLLRGRLRNSENRLWMDVSEVKALEVLPRWLQRVKGSYWVRNGNPYLIAPEWIKLSKPLAIEKGSIVEVSGIFYNGVFHPVKIQNSKQPTKELKSGFPAEIRGVVLSVSSPAVLWNGTTKIYLYLPYGTKLKLGEMVKVLGIVKITSRINVYVDSKEDVNHLGYPNPVGINGSKTGDLVRGICKVTKPMKSGLRLNCTELRLLGFSARTGDETEILALNTGSTLKCIDCRISRPRESLPNSLCSFREGETAKIRGRVSWVRRYSNGFSLANITSESCWVLLKLPKSLGVDVNTREVVTAYGTFVTYRGMPALQPWSGDDVCSGNC